MSSGGYIEFEETRSDRFSDDHGNCWPVIGEDEDERIALLDSLGEGVGIVDLEEIFIFANRAAHRIFGVEEGTLPGRDLKNFISPECLAEIERQTTSRRQGETASYEVEIIRPDGDRASLLVTATPRRDRTGVVTGTLGIFRDMTDRLHAEEEKRQLEAQLVQTSKMQAIGTLSGGIAHDFNNILSAIIGYTQLALDHAVEGSLQRSNLEEVLLASRRATDLVHQILTFARRMDQGLEPIDIAPVIKEAMRLIRSSLPSSITIEQRIDAGGELVLANPTQVHQIVMNLCTNAAHAMNMGHGVLRVLLDKIDLVAPSPMMVKGGGPGPYLRLQVSDTGVGMEPEMLDSIFDPYFTTREPGEGTGLGLSVVLGIVQTCKGDLGVVSKPGQGSTFTVLLPVTEKPEVERSEETWQTLEGCERVLFVDDEPSLVELGETVLAHLGYRVTGSASSREALELVRADPAAFDLVVTDLTMPGMKGDELARQIWQLRPDLPVVLSTGYDGPGVRERACAMGFSSVACKPFSREELARAVRGALDGERGEAVSPSLN